MLTQLSVKWGRDPSCLVLENSDQEAIFFPQNCIFAMRSSIPGSGGGVNLALDCTHASCTNSLHGQQH